MGGRLGKHLRIRASALCSLLILLIGIGCVVDQTFGAGAPGARIRSSLLETRKLGGESSYADGIGARFQADELQPVEDCASGATAFAGNLCDAHAIYAIETEHRAGAGLLDALWHI